MSPRRILLADADAFFVAVQAFGPGEVEVPLVDARSFDDGSEALEHGANLPALFGTGASRHGHAHRLGA